MKRFCQWLPVVILCVITSGLFCGCAGSHSSPQYVSLVLSTVKIRPSVALKEVKIYTDPNSIPGKYEEVGIITIHGNYAQTDLAGMYEALRVEAARFGANGVIFVPGEAQRADKATAIYVFPEKQS